MPETLAASKPIKIDLNDPTAVLPDDEYEFDPDADAFAGPAPLNDGEHIVTLKLSNQGVISGVSGKGVPYTMVNIEATVTDEGDAQNNYKVFDSASPSVSEFTGTSRIAGIMQVLGADIPARGKQSDLVRAFVDTLNGSPQCKVTTKWEGFCADCPNPKKDGALGLVVVRGQRNFPEGKHSVACPKCGGEVSAKAKITKYSKR